MSSSRQEALLARKQIIIIPRVKNSLSTHFTHTFIFHPKVYLHLKRLKQLPYAL